ncbi:MAG TPA: DUF1778 domain-containing protein [Mycobacteriales bacterium]|nr:DUF1778 domain-containing protein [Mycobacteriales bacterium]
MAKSARVELRADQASRERMAAAAALGQESLSAFVLRSALAEADRVLARSDSTVMPAEQFDALIDSLEQADPAPVLAKAAARRRGYSRR